jgi:hypothetical protein
MAELADAPDLGPLSRQASNSLILQRFLNISNRLSANMIMLSCADFWPFWSHHGHSAVTGKSRRTLAITLFLPMA